MANTFESWEDRIFLGALTFSIGVHVVAIGYLSYKKVHRLARQEKTIEVVYEKLKSSPVVKKEHLPQEVRMIKQMPITKQIDIFSKKEQSWPKFLESRADVSKLSNPMRIGKKENPILKTENLERRITIPVLDSEKISNPKYLSYNEGIRERIRQKAYTFIDHPDFASGEVYLTFIVSTDGMLKNLQVIESRTKANEYLRNVGIKSIQESQPFAPFPKDLNYPELTFNVVISFEVNE